MGKSPFGRESPQTAHYLASQKFEQG